jgi:hypothetical protein
VACRALGPLSPVSPLNSSLPLLHSTPATLTTSVSLGDDCLGLALGHFFSCSLYSECFCPKYPLTHCLHQVFLPSHLLSEAPSAYFMLQFASSHPTHPHPLTSLTFCLFYYTYNFLTYCIIVFPGIFSSCLSHWNIYPVKGGRLGSLFPSLMYLKHLYQSQAHSRSSINK